MNCNRHSVDLTPQDLAVIESALQTQEKILSVQSQTDSDGSARVRLGQLKRVLKTLQRQTPEVQPSTNWTSRAWTLFN